MHLSKAIVSFTVGEPRSPRADVAKIYCRLRLILRLRASAFSVLKLTENVILLAYNTIPSCFSLIGYFRDITFKLLNFFFEITDEGSVREIGIWSIF